MSPPIRDGSGSSIGSIRLGDGSEIAEVRTGAGDVVFSSGPTIVDDFEDNDLSEYTKGFGGFIGGGVSSGVGIINSPVFEGSHALKVSNSSGLFSTSGLANYPSQGDTFQVRQYIDAGTQQQSIIAFGVQDANNCYALAVNNTNSALRLFNLVSGSATIEFQKSFTYPTEEWLKVQVEWSSSNITATVFDSSGTELISGSAQDNTYTSGGIGFAEGKSDTSLHAAFDKFVIL